MIRIAICDDEEFFRKQIEDLTRRNFDQSYELSIDVFDSIAKLDRARNIADYDIFLLDIEIHNDSGIEYARTIRNTNNTALIIFVTAYDRYAIDGYGTRAMDYILKPVREQQLKQALATAFGEIESKFKPVNIVENKRAIILNQHDIVYAEKQGRYTMIYLKNNDEYEVRETLKSLLERLDTETLFFAISQSIAVNVRYVRNVQSQEDAFGHQYQVEMFNGAVLPFSRRGYKDFKVFFARSLGDLRKWIRYSFISSMPSSKST